MLELQLYAGCLYVFITKVACHHTVTGISAVKSSCFVRPAHVLVRDCAVCAANLLCVQARLTSTTTAISHSVKGLLRGCSMSGLRKLRHLSED